MPKLRDFSLPLAVALSIFLLGRALPESRHKEAHEAETIVNALSKKLHGKLLTLDDTLHKTKEEISATIKELTILKKVDVLLGQLNNRQESRPLCEHDYIVVDFRYKQNILIAARSALPSHYTISVQVNHKFLVDEKKTTKDGEDLRVFYLHNDESLPVEIDRIITDLYTTSTTIKFRTQRVIPANTVDTTSYALVFGGKSTDKAKADPKNVFLFHEDFSNSTLRGWKRVWGEWAVKNGSLFGKTGRSLFGSGEVGLYLKEGKEWGDIEVQLDLMETGTGTVYPGPLLRVQESGLQHTTAWWFEYMTDQKECTMRPFVDNNDGNWKYKCQLPRPFVKNKWFRFKYRLIGNKISQWANGVSIQNIAVQNTWMIPRGTIGFGCHTVDSGIGCMTYYDNLRVRLVVESNPTVSPGDTCYLAHYNDLTDGDKERPGDSCRQIHDANRHRRQKSSAKNGVYWLRTGINGEESTSTFCDMENGGWTLIGKISGSAGIIYQRWLVENVNTELLKSPNVNSRDKLFACLDARRLAVRYSSEIMLSSSENPLGIGAKWIQWNLPMGREYSTWWNYGVGQARVKAADTHHVTVKAWNGKTQVCYQNKYGIMPLQQHGGSYPYTSFNRQGNTKVNDYCMAVGVLVRGSNANGWSQNANGYDSPQSDSDWPNTQYNHQSPHLLVWLK